VLQTIGQDNFFSSDDGVIPCCLFKCFLRKFYLWSFAFDQDNGLCFFSNQKVNSFRKTVQKDLFLCDKCRWGIGLYRKIIVHPVLPHPFFGSKEQVSFADQVINKKLIFVFLEFKIKSVLKIQFWKFHLLR